jgi:plastocyanin
VVLSACGDDGDDSDQAAVEPVSEITITATGIAFDVDQFTVTSGDEITITFDNQHEGVPHNISFEGVEDGATELAEGPDAQQLTFTAPAPGEYEFQCDAHPPQMRGTMVVR